MRIVDTCPYCGCLPGERHECTEAGLEFFCECGDLDCDGCSDYCEWCGACLPACESTPQAYWHDRLIDDQVVCKKCGEKYERDLQKAIEKDQQISLFDFS